MLDVEAISKRYGRDAPEVLAGVSLRAPAGACTAVLGRSGGGKSTLLRIIAGLETPDAGTVSVDGRAWSGRPPERRDVGLAFQSLVVHPHLTVRGNVRMAADAAGRARRASKEAVEAALAATGLDQGDLADRRPEALSGGQLQRVALARMLARAPRVCLLDEPLAHLDPPARLELRSLVRRLVRDPGPDGDGRIVVFVTHDPGEAMRLGDRLAILAPLEGLAAGSRIHQVGPPEGVAADPDSLAVADATGLEPINLLSGAGVEDTLGVRPESLRIESTDVVSPSGSDIVVEARVRSTVVVPGGRSVELEPVAPWEARRPLRVRLGRGDRGRADGDRVRLLIGPSAAWRFDGGGRRVRPGGPQDS